MLAELRTACLVLLVLTILTGVLYPLAITGIAALAFPAAAGGSLIRTEDGRVAGSSLIGQPFDAPGYFWGRPSGTPRFAYNASASSGSNLGPTNPALRVSVIARVVRLRAAEAPDGPVPVDLVTASGSGLDPHVSLAAAEWQVPRVARARGLDETAVRALVARNTQDRDFGFLGEPVVNILALNLALDDVSR